MFVDPTFAHLMVLSDDHGIIEHASGAVPRDDCGYCLDDVARALIVLCRSRTLTPEIRRLAASYFLFVTDAQAYNGACRNRRGPDGRWQDEPGLGDWWGRALWALGTVAARGPDPAMRATAVARFGRSARQRSPYLRAMAFASLGAAEMLTAIPDSASARTLLRGFGNMVGRINVTATWPWPEPRLTYANAAVAEAMIAAGAGLNDEDLLADGLHLLGWLLDLQTSNGHLSVVPVGGRGPQERPNRYDQQPIEVAAIADACVRGFEQTGEQRWADGLDLAIAWFLGRNDQSIEMWDPRTGGGFDALTPGGRNTNQGAESTLAMLATLQHRSRLSAVRR
jgi:hypothetical protein